MEAGFDAVQIHAFILKFPCFPKKMPITKILFWFNHKD